jgi:dihydropyrimidinase
MNEFTDSTQARTIIKGGTIVTAENSFPGDLLIAGAKIAAVASDLPAAPGDHVIDASGCVVLPGIIDAHTHIQLDTGIFRTPDDWLIGTRAAACGGVTTVIDFATQLPGQGLTEAVKDRCQEAQSAVIDYALHCMVTDLPPGRESELEELLEAGVPSIKLYTTYRPKYYADDGTLLRLMRAAGERGILTTVHCENDALVTTATEGLVAAGETELVNHGRARPALAEVEAVNRVLFLADATDAPVYIVHCSLARSVELVAHARARGQIAYAETCPQYLLLDESLYDGKEPFRFILQPPLRAAENNEGLWRLLENGVVDVVASDSCDYTLDQKIARPDFTRTPGGLPGIETLLPLMVTYGVAEHRLSWSALAGLLATNPARIFGLYPTKGTLLPGADADVTIYDPAEGYVLTPDDLHGLAGYTPFAGFPLRGRVKMTLSRGQVVYEQGEFTGRPGHGRFVAGHPLATSPRGARQHVDGQGR